jgi:hypothetical protein
MCSRSIPHDRVHPCSELGTTLKLVQLTESLKQTFLQSVFAVLRTSQHLHGTAAEPMDTGCKQMIELELRHISRE